MARTEQKITETFLLNRVAKVVTANAQIKAVRDAAESVKDSEAKKLVLSSVSDLAILAVNARKKVIGEIFERLTNSGTPEDLTKLVKTFSHILDPETISGK